MISCCWSFYNWQMDVNIKDVLLALGHIQHKPPVKTNNIMAVQFVKDSITNKCNKSWDVRTLLPVIGTGISKQF